MTERATRLLRLLDALRGRRQPVRGAHLAQRLEVSLRTVYRDIEALRAQGAQIAGNAGVGYQLRPGFWLPPMMLSEEELEAILLGTRWVAGHADPELAAAADQAMVRLTAVLPERLRLQAETSALFAPRWQAPPCEPWVPVLRRALRQGHAVRMGYRDGQDAASERVVWPCAMAFASEVRLLAAWCTLRGDFRHFRADRIVWLEDTGQRYPAARHQLLRRWRAQCLPARGG